MTDLQVPSVRRGEVMEGGFEVVDVRSPANSRRGMCPGAVNMPLLDDAQRAMVGIAYKHEGRRKGAHGGHGRGQLRPGPLSARPG